MSTDPTPANRQIARAAGMVMAAFILSQVSGLVLQVLVTKTYGTSLPMEAFNAANRLAETLFNLVAGGALGSAFIPTFTTLLTLEKHRSAWQLASAISNLVLVISTSLSVIAAIFAPQIVRHILAPGFAADPVKEALTIDLLRLMLPSVVIFGVSGMVMGILNSHQVFLTPALTPSMYRLGMLFGLLALSPKMGIHGLAWGVVIGACLHLVLQIPALIRQRGKYYLILGLKLPQVREVARLMGPRLFGVVVVQLNFWVNTFLASQQPEGSVTSITVAFTLMLMPQAAIAQSIATAAMPTFAAQVARGRLDQMRVSFTASLRGVLFLSIPASLGLVLLRKPIIVMLYQRGEFTEQSTEMVAWALLWYAAGLVGHSVVEILARAFYALHDTKTPVIVGTFAMSLNVILSVTFARLFAQIGLMPLGGLALANSVATALEMIGLLVLMHRRLNGLNTQRILTGALQAIAAGSAMSLVLWIWLKLTAESSAWIVGGGGVIFGGVIYGLVTLILKVEEARGLVISVRKRLRTRA